MEGWHFILNGHLLTNASDQPYRRRPYGQVQMLREPFREFEADS